jgi:DNA-binding NarL/FixJ family response regulator
MITVLALCKKGVFIESLRPYLHSGNIDIVAICNDSETALRKFQKKGPDIVIMDANWPIHPNYTPAPEFIQRVRERDPTCKIILMTNTQEVDIPSKFKDLNISGYFYRNMDDVINSIVTLIYSTYAGETCLER